MNNNLILITGSARSGKSSCFSNIKNPEGVLYLNTENNKGLPFKTKFKTINIEDPYQVYGAFEMAEESEKCHTIIIDSITYLLEMFETMYVHDATNTLEAWSDYGQYYRKLMSSYVSLSNKNVIATGHSIEYYNKAQNINETIVKVKGSLGHTGLESGYSLVLSTQRHSTDELSNYKCDLLNITEREERMGFKHVFQTQATKDNMYNRIGSPMGMWEENEVFIDADINIVLERIKQYHS